MAQQVRHSSESSLAAGRTELSDGAGGLLPVAPPGTASCPPQSHPTPGWPWGLVLPSSQSSIRPPGDRGPGEGAERTMQGSSRLCLAEVDIGWAERGYSGPLPWRSSSAPQRGFCADLSDLSSSPPSKNLGSSAPGHLLSSSSTAWPKPIPTSLPTRPYSPAPSHSSAPGSPRLASLSHPSVCPPAPT